MKARHQVAIHGHDFRLSGVFKRYADGNHEACLWCGWPADEHPDHPTRKDNPHIVAVDINPPYLNTWGGRR